MLEQLEAAGGIDVKGRSANYPSAYDAAKARAEYVANNNLQGTTPINDPTDGRRCWAKRRHSPAAALRSGTATHSPMCECLKRPEANDVAWTVKDGSDENALKTKLHADFYSWPFDFGFSDTTMKRGICAPSQWHLLSSAQIVLPTR